VKALRQPNGKCIYDIREQYNRIQLNMIAKQVKETNRLIAEGKITNEEQYKAHRAKQDAEMGKLYDIASKMASRLHRRLIECA
jgi:hypothetical protein